MESRLSGVKAICSKEPLHHQLLLPLRQERSLKKFWWDFQVTHCVICLHLDCIGIAFCQLGLLQSPGAHQLIFLKCNWLVIQALYSWNIIGWYSWNVIDWHSSNMFHPYSYCLQGIIKIIFAFLILWNFFPWQIIPQLKTTCWVHVPVTIGSSLLMLKFASSSANLKQNSPIIQVVHKMFFLQNKLKKW